MSTVSAAVLRATFLTGPTASGKTACGVALARRIGAEIVAMDSMTLYRGMDIGTAKPTEAERQAARHHLIDVLAPWESASLAEYLSWARSACADIEARGMRVLFVGGTPLYLKGLLRGLFAGPAANAELRAALEKTAEEEGEAALHVRLARVDPKTARRLHPQDRRRVVRALEVFELTGRPLSDLQREHDRPASGVRVLALSRPRAELHGRIDRRVCAMFDEGLVDEVRHLLAAPRPPHPVPMQGIGYREVQQHLEGVLDLPETIARTQARTRQFAKRQDTWFRGLVEVTPFPVDRAESPEEIGERLARAIGP